MTRDETIEPRGVRRRIRRWVLVGILLLLLVGFAGFRMTLQRMYHDRLEAIRAGGEPATFADIEKTLRDLPPEQNAAFLIEEASRHYDNWHWTRKVINVPICNGGLQPGRDEPLAAEVKADAAAYLNDNAQALKFLHQAAAIGQAVFARDLTFNASLPHLSPIRRGSELLNLEGVLAAENGEDATAAQCFADALRLANQLREEPFLISHIVRIKGDETTLYGIERAVNRTGFTGIQLVALTKAINEADDADAFYRAILSERCCMTDVASRPVSSLMGPAGFDRQTLWSTFYFLSGLHSVDRICLLDRMTELVGAARLPTHRRMAAVSAWQSKAENVPRHRILLHVFLSAVDRSCITDLNHVAQVRAARAGLAVERYRLAHGRYPETLDALVPEFLDAVPEDPFDGKPLRYQARANGFVVYSVGHDLADNGGRERDVAGASRVFGGSPALVRPYPPGSDVTFAVGPQPEPALSLPAGGPPR